MEPQLTEFKRCFIRISKEDGIPVGAGFLVSDGHVLTCAHVVATALRMSEEDMDDKPQGVVHLDFPFLGAAARTAHVTHWLPPSGPSTNPSGDIAVLQLATTPPDSALPTRLTAEGVTLGRKFQAHGYPQGYDAGVWAYGELRDRLGNGWLQVEDTKGTGGRIEPGFSGGPVEDQASDRIIGMVVASTRERTEKVGFVIPADVLADAYPAIEVYEPSYREEQPTTKAIINASNTDQLRPMRKIKIKTPLFRGPTHGTEGKKVSPDNKLGVGIGRHDESPGFSRSRGIPDVRAKTIHVWRLKDGKHLRALRPPDNSDQFRELEFSPDGRLLASTTYRSVLLWRIEDGVLVRTLEHFKYRVDQVAFSPDGKLLVGVCAVPWPDFGGRVALWRVEDGSLVRTLEQHEGEVNQVAFSPDVTLLISTGAGRGPAIRAPAVWMWRVEDGILLRKLQTGDLGLAQLSADGTILFGWSSGNWGADRLVLWGTSQTIA
jgi:hypothetical protein